MTELLLTTQPLIPKVKPYTVVDLSTKTILSDEEIYKCLKQASEKEILKQTGNYGYNADHAKENGDAPNCLKLPPKLKKNHSFSLPEDLNIIAIKLDVFTRNTNAGYDDIPIRRERSNTVPANYDLPNINTKTSSRLVQPFSPGCTKRKVQQKLQRDAKQQLVTPKVNGTSGSLQKPVSRINKFGSPSSIRNTEELKQNGRLSEQRQNVIPSPVGKASNKIPQSNFRSTLPRLSHKNSDAASSSESSSDSGSCRSTPVYGGSPLYKTVSPPIENNVKLPVKSSKSGIPSRSTVESKRSLESLRLSRENIAESLKQTKNSSSSIPYSRSKQSCESLKMSRENTAKDLRVRNDSCSSLGSYQSDTSETDLLTEANKYSSPHDKCTGSLDSKFWNKIRRDMDRKGSLDIPKFQKPISGIPSSGIKQPMNSESKLLPPSGLAKPSHITKPSGILKPTSKSTSEIEKKSNIPGILSITQPSIAYQKTNPVASISQIKKPKQATNSTAVNNSNQGCAEAATSVTMKNPSLLKNETTDHSLSKKPSKQANIDNQDETKSLEHPTVGKVPEALEIKSKLIKPQTLSYTSRSHSPLRFTPSNEGKMNSQNIKKFQNKVNKEGMTNKAADRSKQNGESKLLLNGKKDVPPNNENGLVQSSKKLWQGGQNILPQDGTSGTLNKVNKERDELNLFLREQEDNVSSDNEDDYDKLYTLDIPSPPGNESNHISDHISYSYDNTKFTHQNVELILAETIDRSKTADNITLCKHNYVEPDDSISKSMEGQDNNIRYSDISYPEANGKDSFSDYTEPSDSIFRKKTDNKETKTYINNQTHLLQRDPTSSLPSIPDEFSRSQHHIIDKTCNRLENTTPVSSPFKHIQPKVSIPPPQLDSSIEDRLLALLPNEYMRTPSSDGEEFTVSHYYSEIGDIRRKAREQAVKTWKKNVATQEEKHERIEVNVNADVFDTNKVNEDSSDKFTVRNSVRQTSDGNASPDDNMYQNGGLTLEKGKKKKSKLKKFFKKLSSKKEGKIENEKYDEQDVFHASENVGRISTSSTSSSIKGTEPYSTHCLNSIGNNDIRKKSTSSSNDESKKELDVEHLRADSNRFSNSSDSSLLSSESLSSSQRSSTQDTPNEHITTGRTSSLRRTPLRRSIDSYSKLLEVHKQTIDKIAFEVSRLRCDCDALRDLDWEDFENTNDAIQLGVSNYMVVPVTSTSQEKKAYTAWLRLEQKQVSIQAREFPNINYPQCTLHRNCLHVCHSIVQTYAAPFQDGIPKAIQIDCVYISPLLPKMTLSRYTSITLEKHSRYPEIYERDTAMILLQVVRGIQHYYRNGVFLSSIESENVFILNNGDSSVVLSPRKEPNKCPAVVLAVLPGLGNSFEKSEQSTVASICYQLAFLLYELLHSPYHDELRDATDMSMLLATLPDLTIKSIYSRYLQYVINLLLGSDSHNIKSFEDLKLILEVILFGPSDISDHSEEDAIVLINKWHNRRCVDMVTHILKEAPLIMLCAGGAGGQDVERIKTVDQEILLECEFLSDITTADIYRISKMLNR